MRILLLTDGIFPYETGGMQKHSYYLAKYLLKKDHSICLVHSIQKANANKERKNIFDVLEIENKNKFNEIQLLFPTSIKFPGHYLYNSYRYSKLVYKSIKSILKNFDYIYIQGFAGWHLLNQIHSLSIINKIKVITNFHGLEMFQLNVGFRAKMQSVLLRHFVKSILHKSPYIHSLGGKLTKILQQNLGINASKIIIAPIGIEKKWIRTTPLNENNEILNFVFIGRNEPRKGFPILKKVLEEFEENSKFHLHVIGPFIPTKSPAQTYYGLINNEDEIISIMDKCQILVCPSFAEGMPTVILEAMSRGCAIVATDVGAISEEVNNENGWLIVPANENSLRSFFNEIKKLTPDDLMQKRLNSLQSIKDKFLWDNLIDKLFK